MQENKNKMSDQFKTTSPNRQYKSPQRKITLLVLITVVLILFIIAFELLNIRNRQPVDPQATSLILEAEKVERIEETPEKNKILGLHKQNQLQAQKIEQLNHKLFEASKELQKLKMNIFTPENFEENHKLVAATQRLKKSREMAQELNQTIDELKGVLVSSENSIQQLEATKSDLLALLDIKQKAHNLKIDDQNEQIASLQLSKEGLEADVAKINAEKTELLASLEAAETMKKGFERTLFLFNDYSALQTTLAQHTIESKTAHLEEEKQVLVKKLSETTEEFYSEVEKNREAELEIQNLLFEKENINRNLAKTKEKFHNKQDELFSLIEETELAKNYTLELFNREEMASESLRERLCTANQSQQLIRERAEQAEFALLSQEKRSQKLQQLFFAFQEYTLLKETQLEQQANASQLFAQNLEEIENRVQNEIIERSQIEEELFAEKLHSNDLLDNNLQLEASLSQLSEKAMQLETALEAKVYLTTRDELKIADLASTSTALELELAEVKGNLEQLQHEIEANEVCYIDAKHHRLDLEQALEERDLRLKSLQEELENYAQKYDNSQKQLLLSLVFVDDLHNQMSEEKLQSEKNCESIQNQLDKVIADLSAEQERAIELDQLLRQDQGALVALTDQEQILKAELNEQTIHNQKLTEAFEKLIEERNHLTASLSETSASTKQRQFAQLEQLSNAKISQEQAQNKLAQLTAQMRDKTEESELLQANLEMSIHEANSLKQEFENFKLLAVFKEKELQDRLEAKRTIDNALAEQVAELDLAMEQEQQKQQMLKQQLNTLSEQYARQEEHNHSLTEQLLASANDKALVEKQQQELQNLKNAYNTLQAHLKKQNSIIQHQREVEERFALLNAFYEREQLKSTSLKGSLEQSQQELITLQTHAESYKQKSEESEAQLNEIIATQITLQENFNDQYQELSDVIEVERQRSKEVSEKLQIAMNNFNIEQKRAEDLEQELHRLTSQLDQELKYLTSDNSSED